MRSIRITIALPGHQQPVFGCKKMEKKSQADINDAENKQILVPLKKFSEIQPPTIWNTIGFEIVIGT